MSKQIIILILVIFIIFIILTYRNQENITSDSGKTLSDEALQTIASVYNTQNMIVTNLNSTGNTQLNSLNVNNTTQLNSLNVNSNIKAKGNINVDGNITFNGNLNIVNPSGNKFIINGIDFRDYVIGCTLSSVNPNTTEYKYGANGGSQHFTIGKWSFCGIADSGFNDVADNIIVNPGFGVKLWTNCYFNSDNNNNTEYVTIENKDIKPARIGFHGTIVVLETNQESGVSEGIYTHNTNLVTINNTSTTSLQNTISSLEVYKL